MDSGQVNKRNGNRYAILRALQFDGPSRRGQIARKYGIRQSSVTGIAAELLQAGLIREQQPGNSRSLLELDTSRFHALVGNLTPAFCRIACVYLDGRIAESREISLVHALDAPAILDTVARGFAECLAEGDGRILGLGLAMPGTVDPGLGRCIYAARLQWRNLAVADELRRRLGFDVFIDNDVRCQLWSSVWFERLAPALGNTIYLSVHQGLACAMIMNGRRIIGEHCAAGEIGHVRVGEEGRLCHCGRTDCLEAYCSVPAILSEIERIRPTMNLKTASNLADEAEEDPLVLNVLDRAARRLARALAGLIAVTDPHTLVIGTADRRFSTILHDLLKRHLYTELIGLSGNDAQLVVADSVEDSALRGVAGLVIDRAFAIGSPQAD
ncbi:MAG: hypothetical protein A3K19_10130 [Lentisphaerae bacterium RIFOXYB12_FULL_65_16]|nr:MAG: hypothetical protein A3K18_27710 [Lentisphaerae bacterium RIFOXYA12_64_32]OGV91305.1 MAG: hypothetical protein A3K19_10130 [Lentisphaerae bacterium RIFOXYB12_FULL_65_16]